MSAVKHSVRRGKCRAQRQCGRQPVRAGQDGRIATLPDTIAPRNSLKVTFSPVLMVWASGLPRAVIDTPPNHCLVVLQIDGGF